MPKIQELTASGRPRRPDIFREIPDWQWERLLKTKPLRWKIVEKSLKVEHIKKPKKVKL